MKKTTQHRALPVENHEAFLRRIRKRFDERESNLVDLAYDLAKYGHRGQLRDAGERYFEHCRGVTLIILDELQITNTETVILSLMHDLWEDSFLLNPWRTTHIFGASMTKMLNLLTKPKLRRDESKEVRNDRYFRVFTESGVDVVVLVVKCADRLHNLRSLHGCTPAKQRRKIAETLKYFPAIVANLRIRPDLEKFFNWQFARHVPGWPTKGK